MSLFPGHSLRPMLLSICACASARPLGLARPWAQWPPGEPCQPPPRGACVISWFRSQRAALFLPLPRSWLAPCCGPEVRWLWGSRNDCNSFLDPGQQERGVRVWMEKGPLPCPSFQAQPRTSLSPRFSSWQRVIIEFAGGLRMKKENPSRAWD